LFIGVHTMRLFYFIIVLLILLAFPACEINFDKDKEKEETTEKKVEKIPVEVLALSRGSIESILKSTTHIEAEEEVRVLARTSNLVRELLVEEGDLVEKDQVILLIEDDQQLVNLAKAENDVLKIKMEFDRQENLHKNNLISDQDFNEIKYSLLQIKLTLEEAQRELEYTRVKAPISGTVTGRHIKLGDQIANNQHLFDLVDFESLVARIYLPENHLKSLVVDQKARIRTTAMGDQVYKGFVKRIAPVVDSKTGTVKVTIGVGNQKGLKPGMYVDVELVLNTHDNALLIPKRALTYDADQIFVFKLKEERKVERILVTPILSDKLNIEPLEGFEEGELVVIAGQSGLKDGALVKLPGDPDDEPDEEESDEKK